MVLPRFAGKFWIVGGDDTALISWAAVEAWICCARLRTAMPTSCLIPVSATLVESFAIVETSIFTPVTWPILDLRRSFRKLEVYF